MRRRRAMNDVNLYFTAVIHSHKKSGNLFNVQNTFHTNSFTFTSASSSPSIFPCSSHSTLGVKYFVLRFCSLLHIFFADCRHKLSCRCIKDVKFTEKERNTSYLLKENRAMIYTPTKSKKTREISERRTRRKAEWQHRRRKKRKALCIVATEKFALYSIEIWHYMEFFVAFF